MPLLVIRPTPCKIVICGGSSEDFRESSSVASRLLFVPDMLLDVLDDEDVDDLTALGFSPLKESFPRTTFPYEDILDMIYFNRKYVFPFDRSFFVDVLGFFSGVEEDSSPVDESFWEDFVELLDFGFLLFFGEAPFPFIYLFANA